MTARRPLFRRGDPRGILATALCAVLWARASWGATDSFKMPDYTVNVWQLEEGLPQISVTSLAQTPDGYLWLGTFNGLARFDGIRFTVFDEGNAPALGSSRITRLAVDAQGALWIVTEVGGLAQMTGTRFTACRPEDGLPPSGALSLVRDETHRLLLLDRNGNLLRIENGRLLPLDPRDGLQAGREPSLLLAPDGSAWVAEQGNATRSSQRTFRVRPPDGSNTPPAKLVIECAAPSPGGGYWLATTTGVYQLRAGRLKQSASSLPDPAMQLHFLVEDAQGNLWFGGAERGLVRWDWRRGQAQTFQAGTGLADNHVSALLCDREGNVWVGTGQGGLHRFKPRLVRMYDPPGGLAGNVVTAVTEDRLGRIWVGVNGGGVHRWEAGRLTPVTEPPELARFPLVYSVLAAREDALWIGLYGRTALRLQNGTVTVCPLGESGLRIAPRALFEDHAGTVWLGTERGLQRYQAGRFTSYTRAEGLSHDDVRALAEDRHGTLYVGTSGGGLNCLRAGRFTCFTERQGLADNHISALYVDREDTVWIGTINGGLSRFKQGRFANVTVKDGLPSNTIGAVIEDGLGYLWLGSNRGLVRVPQRELNDYLDGRRRPPAWQVFGRSDGLNSIGCDAGGQPACCRARDGRLWFATVNGVAVVDPSHLPFNPQPPPVVIEEVVLDDRRCELPSSESRLPTPNSAAMGVVNKSNAECGSGSPSQLHGAVAQSPRTLTVPPRTQRIEFRFTGLSLVAPEKVRFRYRLDGFDEDWIEAGPQRTAYYTRIPPAEYRFRVTACNNDGVWNDAGAALDVVVQSAWWQTWWFHAGAFTGAAGLLGWTLEARLRRARRERAARQSFAHRLLESQEDERKRIAGELHDSLGQDLLVIKNRALLGLRDPAVTPQAADQLGEISQLASHTLEEVREISRNLRPYQLDRLGLTKALQARVAEVSRASDVPINTQIDPIDRLLAPPLEIHFYRIVQELLTNLVKHSHAATATLTVQYRAPKIVLTLEDDGCGFDATLLDEATPRHGLGLTDIAERIRLLNGTARCDSRPAAGTRWVIEIPVSSNRAP